VEEGGGVTDEWIETELWNFVHAAAMTLGLPESAEPALHREMQIVLTAHGIYLEVSAEDGGGVKIFSSGTLGLN
jgi:hypothetical protein